MIAAIIARLKTVPEVKLVEGLGAYSALEEPPLLTPAAYVLPAATDAAPQALATGGHRQALTETVQVVLVTRNLRDAAGALASQDLVTVRDAARAALLGWAPGAEWTPLELTGGTLLAMEADAVVWRDQVASRTWFRKTP